MIFFRKAVLIIHGFAGGTYDQEKLANYLERRSRLDVYTFTLPGHEKRVFKTIEYTEWINACEDQLKTLIKYGYRDIYLIGHSMGGVIATYLAAKYRRVKKLVLVAPAFEHLASDDSKNTFDKIKIGIGAIKKNNKDEVLTRFLKLPISCINEFLKLVKQYKTCYTEISIPTLILHGDKDRIVPVESSQKIYDSLDTEEKKLVILKDGTHDVFKSGSSQALVEVDKFLVY